MSSGRGQWVVMPPNYATGNGGPGLGALLRGRQVDGRMVQQGDNRPRNQQPAVRWQEPDGTLRLLGPNGSMPSPDTRPVPWMSPQQRQGLSAVAASGAAPRAAGNGNRQAPPPPPTAAPRQQPAAAQQNTVPVPAMTPMNWEPAATSAPAAGQGDSPFTAVGDLSPQEQDVWRQMSFPGNPIRQVQRLAPENGGGPDTEGLGPDSRYEPDLATRRRAAFLGASDSMSGLKAVRSVLADEARAQGADISAGGAIPSIRFLENEIAKRQPITREVPIAEVSENDRAALQAMQFPGNPITRVSQVSVPARAGGQEAIAGQMPSEAPRAVVDAYMRDALANKVRQSMPPLNEVAPWQTGGINIAAPRTEPGRDAMLAAFAAQGEKHPSTPGEGLGMLMAGTAAGTRNGQSKPGNSYLLGHVDPKLLPPLGSSGLRISGGGFFQNPGNFYG